MNIENKKDLLSKKNLDEKLVLFKKIAYLLRNKSGSMFYPAANVWESEFSISELKRVWQRVANQKNKKEIYDKIGLYFHIPFCNSKCFYCNCPSFPEKREKVYDQYIDCMEKEIEIIDFPQTVSLSTVYIGGGTPSILKVSQLERLLKLVHNKFNLEHCEQIMMEVSPLTTSLDKLKLLNEYGVNKITIGAQTLDNDLLKKINRPQTREGVIETYKNARKTGIKYINIDLMAGLPGQKQDSFINSVNEVIDLKPDTIHINPFFPSARTVFSKKGNEMSKDEFQRRKKLVNIAYQLIRKRLPNSIEKRGHKKENLQLYNSSRKNCSVLGIGAQALSHAKNQAHYMKSFGFEKHKDYVSELKKEGFPKIVAYRLNKKEEMRGVVIKRLEEDEEIDINNFMKIFNENPLEVFHKELSFLKTLGKLKISNGKIEMVSEKRMDSFLYSKFIYSPEVINKFEKLVDDDIDDLNFKLKTLYEAD